MKLEAHQVGQMAKDGRSILGANSSSEEVRADEERASILVEEIERAESIVSEVWPALNMDVELEIRKREREASSRKKGEE